MQQRNFLQSFDEDLLIICGGVNEAREFKRNGTVREFCTAIKKMANESKKSK